MKIENAKVLIFKNSEGVREITKKWLLAIGFKESNIWQAANIGEAKEIMVARKVNIVLAGIGVCNEEGPKLLTWCIENSRREGIFFVYYFGGEESWVAEKAMQDGANGFIKIPANLDRFSQKMAKILAN